MVSRTTAINGGRIAPKVMLFLEDNGNGCAQIIKVWEHEGFDVDADGTTYHRALFMCRCGTEYPVKIRCEDYQSYIRHELDNGFRILNPDE